MKLIVCFATVGIISFSSMSHKMKFDCKTFDQLSAQEQKIVTNHVEKTLQAAGIEKSLVSDESLEKLKDIATPVVSFQKLIEDIKTPEEKAKNFLTFLQNPHNTGILFTKPDWTELGQDDYTRMYIAGLIKPKKIKKVFKAQKDNKTHVIHGLKLMAEAQYNLNYVIPQLTALTFDPTPGAPNLISLQLWYGWAINYFSGFARVAMAFQDKKTAKQMLRDVYFKVVDEVHTKKRWNGLDKLPFWELYKFDERYNTPEKAKACSLLNAYIALAVKKRECGILSVGPVALFAEGYQDDSPKHTPFDAQLASLFLRSCNPFDLLLQVPRNWNEAQTPELRVLNNIKQVGENPQAADEAKVFSLKDTLTVLRVLLKENYFEREPRHIGFDTATVEQWKKNIKNYLNR